MVKPILAVLFASLVVAQHRPVGIPTGGGCGPDEVQFDVVTNKDQHPVVQAEAGKALVYVIEGIERGPTMRVGLDGVWVGANKGKSYFFFSVDEGDHQLCTKWQSGIFKKTAQRIGSATALNAESGKAYYFRIQVYERSEHDSTVKLEPVESPKASS